MEQEYIITVFSENKVGLLSQITTVFTCRNVNIESLTTSESALLLNYSKSLFWNHSMKTRLER